MHIDNVHGYLHIQRRDIPDVSAQHRAGNRQHLCPAGGRHIPVRGDFGTCLSSLLLVAKLIMLSGNLYFVDK